MKPIHSLPGAACARQFHANIAAPKKMSGALLPPVGLSKRWSLQPGPHARNPSALVLLALLASADLLGLVGCSKPAPVAPPPPVVQVMEVTTTNARASVEFIGQLDSPQNVEVRARVEAFVDKFLFIEGTEVKEGAPLFKLDDRPYQEKLAAAKGGLGEAEAALKKYQTDVARLQPLAQKKAVPQQDL